MCYPRLRVTSVRSQPARRRSPPLPRALTSEPPKSPSVRAASRRIVLTLRRLDSRRLCNHSNPLRYRLQSNPPQHRHRRSLPLNRRLTPEVEVFPSIGSSILEVDRRHRGEPHPIRRISRLRVLHHGLRRQVRCKVDIRLKVTILPRVTIRLKAAGLRKATTRLREDGLRRVVSPRVIILPGVDSNDVAGDGRRALRPSSRRTVLKCSFLTATPRVCYWLGGYERAVGPCSAMVSVSGVHPGTQAVSPYR